MQFKLVVDKCQPILHDIDYFQSRKPCTLQAYDALDDLMIYFAANMGLGYEAYRDFFDDEICVDMTFAEKRRLLAMFGTAMEQAHDKLAKYTDLSNFSKL